MAELHDLELTCSDCRNVFVFTVGEQQFYQDRGLAQPKRCPTCRLARKNMPRTGRPVQRVYPAPEQPKES